MRDSVVATAVDEAYASALPAFLSSLAAHGGRDILIVLLLLENATPELETFAVRTASSLGIEALPVRVPGPLDLPPHGRFGHASYLRLFLPEVVADAQRAIYLDVDVLVLANIFPLERLELHGHSIGAVRHPFHWLMSEWNGRLGPSGGRRTYFNSGVLVIDSKEWRRKGIGSRARNLVTTGYDDQDALNIAALHDVLYLDPRWNVYAAKSIIDAADRLNGRVSSIDKWRALERDAFILHFAGPKKPWDDIAFAGSAGPAYAKYQDKGLGLRMTDMVVTRGLPSTRRPGDRNATE